MSPLDAAMQQLVLDALRLSAVLGGLTLLAGVLLADRRDSRPVVAAGMVITVPALAMLDLVRPGTTTMAQTAVVVGLATVLAVLATWLWPLDEEPLEQE